VRFTTHLETSEKIDFVRRLWRQFGGADRTSRVAYLRVSSEAQDTQLQRDALGEAGCVKFAAAASFSSRMPRSGSGWPRPSRPVVGAVRGRVGRRCW